VIGADFGSHPGGGVPCLIQTDFLQRRQWDLPSAAILRLTVPYRFALIVAEQSLELHLASGGSSAIMMDYVRICQDRPSPY